MDNIFIRKEKERSINQFSVFSDNECTKLVVNENAEISREVLKEMYRLVKESGGTKPIIILLQPEINIGKEARDYMYKLNNRFSAPPVAVIAQTLNESLHANFYQKFYKPRTPYRIFKKENEAFDWLKGISAQ
jgi:hypothetical protein